MMGMYVRLLSVLVFAAVFSGCATITNFETIPVEESDFNKPLATIYSEYGDVSYYSSLWRGFEPKLGNFSMLEKKWGKASYSEVHWGQRLLTSLASAALIIGSGYPIAVYAAIETLFLYPQETHYWNKGNKHIEVTVTRTAFSDYERRVNFWRWQEYAAGESEAKRNSTL
ncbi:MAG: hypothetical protein OEY67_10470 [Gammaproteobacteria bacterium]|nr:hypothetical protein [Gammaproteobacteria bacterium]